MPSFSWGDKGLRGLADSSWRESERKEERGRSYDMTVRMRRRKSSWPSLKRFQAGCFGIHGSVTIQIVDHPHPTQLRRPKEAVEESHASCLTVEITKYLNCVKIKHNLDTYGN